MSKLKNLAILASAGSGKTFQLAHRYIRLLAEESEEILPDRICAMTFTRKAAGEIFDGVAEYLCKAALSDEAARLTAEERIDLPHLKRKDFLRILRRFVDNMHRARIGTLDSFIVGIAKAFPFELNIPLDFQVMDTDSVRAAESRQAALSRILTPGFTEESVQNTFLEAFKRATYGHEEKSFGDVLEKMIKTMRSYYRLCPDGTKWGNEDLVWGPGKRPWKGQFQADLSAECSVVTCWAEPLSESGTATEKKFYATIVKIAQALSEYGPNNVWDDPLTGTVFDRLLDAVDALKEGGVSIAYSRKKYDVPADAAEAMYRLLENFLIVEYDRVVTRTVGLYDLLREYEGVYDDVIRSTGTFSFTDIQYLLSHPGSGSSTSVITRNPAIEDRLYIDYRMDCRLDHWLLDEFQDTSDLQWAIFEDLVDEIVQAPPDSSRSFFYVGDIKQAIYRWRGGNHKLFKQVRDKYGKDGIALETMAKTRRCSQPIVDAVNLVFEPPFEGLLPDATTSAWQEAWEKHETAAVDDAGYVSLIEPVPPVVSGDAFEERCVLVADLLKEIDPIARGIEVGILVRTNGGGQTVANTLRRECPGMAVVHEGASAIVENELVQALLSLITLAAHPGDEFAWQYVQMTPLAALMTEEGINRSNISQRFLADVDEIGFQQFVSRWGEKLEQGGLLNDYGRQCLLRLEDAAGEFDQTGVRDCGSFVRFAESYTVKEQKSSRAIRVMTVHQAKGLEFDMVILPELQSSGGGNIGKAKSPDLVRAGTMSETDWILRMPKKALGERDDVLKNQFAAEDAAAGFDSLCLLYVAMTRPRHGLYMITSVGKTQSASVQHSDFVREQLAGERHHKATANASINGRDCVRLYESNPDHAKWYETDWPKKDFVHEPAGSLSLPNGYAEKHDKAPVLRHREPSRQETDVHRAEHLFKGEGSEMMEFGSAIHALLEKVEWASEADVDAIINDWDSSGYEPIVAKDAAEQFRNCFGSSAVAEYMSKPDCDCVLWREKEFEIILNGEFVSGAFDRVTLMKDGSGAIISATILDYKSSRVEQKAEIDKKATEYSAQMGTYREALAKILDIDQSVITCCLLFTRQQETRTV